MPEAKSDRAGSEPDRPGRVGADTAPGARGRARAQQSPNIGRCTQMWPNTAYVSRSR